MLSSCCASRSRARTYQDKKGFTYAAIGRTAQKNGPNAAQIVAHIAVIGVTALVLSSEHEHCEVR